MAIISERFDNLGKANPHQTYRLGIMGGTFDPIHIGHLACAEQARESFSLDAVIFIPAGVPVYKRDQQVTPAHQRLEMCELAVRGNEYFDVSSVEIDRRGDTYTIDTLRQLRRHFPSNVELYFITGADAVVNIIKWKESSAIAELAHMISVARPGYTVSEKEKAEIESHSKIDVSYLEVTALAISSSDLREKVRTGRSIRYLTMKSTLVYIEKNGLYRNVGEGGCDDVCL